MIDKPILEQMTNNVCSTMLGLETKIASVGFQPTDTTWYCAHIGIDGDWQSQVFLICSEGLAQQIASTMFMIEPDELSDGEVGDAIGELVNMLGGNVKGIFPGENTLSLPSVQLLNGKDFIDPTQATTDACFVCEGHPLTIRVSQPIACQTCSD